MAPPIPRRRKPKAALWTRRKRTRAQNPNQVLESIYYDFGKEGALNNTPETLLQLARAQLPTISRSQVKAFLTKQPSYTVHRRIAKLQCPRRPIRVRAPRLRVDADLIELTDLAQWNDGYRYILNCIDTFTKFVWTRPQKNKESSTTAKSFKSMIQEEGLKCELLYTDAGTEFLGAPFQRLLKSHAIEHKTCGGEQFHCPFTERANRTLKEKLFQAMTSQTTRRWVDLLPRIVKTYNNTVHSTTRMKPVNVKDKHMFQVYSATHNKRRRRNGPPRFKKGDYVRILKSRAAFAKGYLPRFTWEIFQIADYVNQLTNEDPHAYFLKDLRGEQIRDGIFYEHELSKVDPSILGVGFPIQEILRRRGDQVLVWWQGFPRSEAEWIPAKNITSSS